MATLHASTVEAMANSVWETDYSVLDYLVNVYTSTPNADLGAEQVARALDIAPDAAVRSLERLYSASPPYLQRGEATPADAVEPVGAVLERGLRATDAWPSDDAALERLVVTLTAAAEDEPDPEKRRRALDIARWFGAAGRDVGVGFATAYAKSMAGMS